MKTFILAVILLTLLSSCDQAISEGDKINSVRRYNDSTGYEMITNHGRAIQSSSKHSVGDIITIQPAQPEISFKLPMRDAESRQCLNCDTVVITHYVDYKEATVTLSDTTIHYYHSH